MGEFDHRGLELTEVTRPQTLFKCSGRVALGFCRDAWLQHATIRAAVLVACLPSAGTTAGCVLCEQRGLVTVLFCCGVATTGRDESGAQVL